MKALSIIALLGLGSVILQATPVEKPANEGIEFFEGNWEAAKAEAAKENKLIFLDAYAVWCGPCKLMKRNVFSDAEVGAYFNQHFVNFEMDMEKGVGRKLAQEWSIKGYPTLIFLDGEGNIVTKELGYHSKEQLLAMANTAMEKQSL